MAIPTVDCMLSSSLARGQLVLKVVLTREVKLGAVCTGEVGVACDLRGTVSGPGAASEANGLLALASASAEVYVGKFVIGLDNLQGVIAARLQVPVALHRQETQDESCDVPRRAGQTVLGHQGALQTNGWQNHRVSPFRISASKVGVTADQLPLY